MSLAIVSGGQRALILGDVAIHPAQVTETIGRDFRDGPGLAAQMRRQVFDRVEAENSTLVACHFPSRALGGVRLAAAMARAVMGTVPLSMDPAGAHTRTSGDPPVHSSCSLTIKASARITGVKTQLRGLYPVDGVCPVPIHPHSHCVPPALRHSR